MLGEYIPKKDWTADERRMHWFIPKLAALAVGIVLLAAAAVALVVHVAC